MHVSLDSALGRQRRLNSVGESVLQIAPSAAAAYSLRSLTGGDPKVVRVRRGSDNHEQDFTASEVSSGALQDFVNAQVVAPLDIQALSATGRDGDFLIAKAAYSLRSLGTRQATLAATGDTVARSDGKYVCQVRRSSDDALKSFTATEVTDGTLLAFTNENIQLFSNDFETNTDGFTLNTGGSNTAVRNTSDGFSGSGCLQLNLTSSSNSINTVKTDTYMQDTDGVIYTVSFYAKAISGSANLVLKMGTTSSSSQQISFSENGGEWVKHSLTFVNNLGAGAGNRNQRILFAASTNNTTEWRIDDFQIVQTTSNGFVKTWYDQSVTTQAGDTATGNHATQATAANQPKIVSAGSLLNELDFDGTEDMALATGSFSLTQAYTTFSVSHTDDASTSQGVWSTAPSVSNQFNAVSFFRNDDGLAVNSGSTLTTAGTIDYVADRTYLQTNVVNGGSSSVFVDGATGATGNAGTNNPSGVLILGFFRVSSANANLDGGIKELIIYDSDQSDNRTAIEANIGEVYSIDLPSGVDPGFDQVDGFVETWYDQSGNGNNAVQATASLQPKIVDAGSLLADGVTFDGTDDVLTSINSSLTNYTFAGVYTVKTITDNTGFLGKGAGASDREFFVRMKSDGKVEHRVYSTGSASTFDTIASSASAISADTTALIAGSFNGSTNAIRLDIDDTVLTATSSVGLYAATSNLTIPSALGSEAHTAIAELLFYNTDESGKLSDIKTNINSHYSIF